MAYAACGSMNCHGLSIPLIFATICEFSMKMRCMIFAALGKDWPITYSHHSQIFPALGKDWPITWCVFKLDKLLIFCIYVIVLMLFLLLNVFHPTDSCRVQGKEILEEFQFWNLWISQQCSGKNISAMMQ